MIFLKGAAADGLPREDIQPQREEAKKYISDRIEEMEREEIFVKN